MRQVYSARDSLEAHFLLGLLEREGIEAVVQGELLSAARGALPMTPETLPSVWVRDEDVGRAREVIDQFRQRTALLNPDTWTCPDCGEHIEEQFTHCWNCGAARPTNDPPQ